MVVWCLAGSGLSIHAQDTLYSDPSYGWRCGIAGAPPSLRYEIEALIAKQDTSAIHTWLVDSNLAWQAYAAEAVIRLDRSGMEQPEWSIAKANALRRSNTSVKSCRGCIKGMMPLRKRMRDFLKLAKRLPDGRSSNGNEHIF